MVVEYRSGVAEKRDFRDKETGRQRTFCASTHNVEAGNLSIQVGEFLPDDANVNAWVQPFKKGTLCVLKIQELRTEKGAHKARGTLEALTD